MSAIGSGQYVRIALFDPDGELLHEGILEPGASWAGRFVGPPLVVGGMSIRRLTRDEVDALYSPASVVEGSERNPR